MIHGYGGVAILLKKPLDEYINLLPDEGDKIRCVEIRLKNPVLIVTVYLPTKATNDIFRHLETVSISYLKFIKRMV